MGVINKTTEEINDLLDKIESMSEEGVVGKTPVLETGTTTTLPAGSAATSEVVSNGTDASGNPKYKLNFGIPKGADGTSSGGGGTADSVDWANVLNKPSWVNSSVKPTYTATEVGALPSTTTIPSKTSQLTNDSGFVGSDGLKTINGQSIVGSGNIEISDTGSGIADAPSDGKIYGRKNGNWSTIDGVGGSVDITDIMNRLEELAAVGGTCTDEDYNTLKGYIENGTITYFNSSDSSAIVDLKYMDGEILLEIGYLIGAQEMKNTFTISNDKNVSVSANYFLSMGIVGNGNLGTYSKPSSYSAITQDDTISVAIGKLEAGLETSGGSSDVYILPETLLNLTSAATKDDILTAMGGTEGYNGILEALSLHESFAIKTDDKSINVDVIKNGFGIVIHIPLYSTSVSTHYGDKDLSIGYGLISIVVEKYKYGYKLSSSLYSITSSSSSTEIQNALGDVSGIEKLEKALSSYNMAYIKQNDTTSIIPLSVQVQKTNSDYLIMLSGVGYGIFGTSIGGTLVISYIASSNTYSASVFTLQAS